MPYADLRTRYSKGLLYHVEDLVRIPRLIALPENHERPMSYPMLQVEDVDMHKRNFNIQRRRKVLGLLLRTVAPYLPVFSSHAVELGL